MPSSDFHNSRNRYVIDIENGVETARLIDQDYPHNRSRDRSIKQPGNAAPGQHFSAIALQTRPYLFP